MKEMELIEQQKADALFKLAKQGSADAQFEIALCYEEGKGIEQNHEEAERWYQKAVEQMINNEGGLNKFRVDTQVCPYDSPIVRLFSRVE